MSKEREPSNKFEIGLKLVSLTLAITVAAVYVFAVGFLGKLCIPVAPSISEVINFFISNLLKVASTKVTAYLWFWILVGVGISGAFELLQKKGYLKLLSSPFEASIDLKEKIENYEKEVIDIKESLVNVMSEAGHLSAEGMKALSTMRELTEKVKGQKETVSKLYHESKWLHPSMLLFFLPTSLYLLFILSPMSWIVFPPIVLILIGPMSAGLLREGVFHRYFSPILITLMTLLGSLSFIIPYQGGLNLINFSHTDKRDSFPLAFPNLKSESLKAKTPMRLLWKESDVSYWIDCASSHQMVAISDRNITFNEDLSSDESAFFCNK